MKIRLIGQANHTGIGRHFQEFAAAVDAYRPNWPVCQADPFDLANFRWAIDNSDWADINICFTAHMIPNLKGRMIQWVPFETTRIPDLIREPLVRADEIWTMTEWSRQCLINNGFPNHKIVTVPQGLNIALTEIDASRSGDLISFLMVAKYEQRKGIKEAIQAWSQTLANHPGYCLTIKSHATANDIEEFDHLKGLIDHEGIENYRLLWGVMADQDLIDLYRSNHVFLAPTYGEGWGRPIMEAAAVGLPVITTRYSAHGEWLDSIADSVCWVDHDLVSVQDENYMRAYGQHSDCGQWAKPCVDSLERAISHVTQHFDLYQSRAKLNRSILRDRYSWQRVVDRAGEILGLDLV